MTRYGPDRSPAIPHEKRETSTDGAMLPGLYLDRRREFRLRGQFPAVVRGRDGKGELVEVETTAFDLSATGFRVQSDFPFLPGEPLFVALHLIGPRTAQGPCIAFRSRIHYIIAAKEGGYLIGCRIQRYRFLSPIRMRELGYFTG